MGLAIYPRTLRRILDGRGVMTVTWDNPQPDTRPGFTICNMDAGIFKAEDVKLQAFAAFDGPAAPDYRHARDIADVVFLRAVETTREIQNRGRIHGTDLSGCTATRWNLQNVLGGNLDAETWTFDDIPGVPWKVVCAKARRLINRGLLEGCDGIHNCRGDYRLTEDGRNLIEEKP
jgi:hypothetical protein